MKNQNKKLYVLSAIIFLGVLILIFSTASRNHVVEPVQQLAPEIPVEDAKIKTEIPENLNTDTARVITGDVITNISFTAGDTFYTALVQAKAGGKIDFSGKNYQSLGFFVTDIGPLHSGGGKDLLYYVNGKEATVGVSLYTPQK